LAVRSSPTSSRSFSVSAVRYSSVVSVVTNGVRPEARIMSGILSLTSLPTMSLPRRDNAVMQLWRQVLTSRVHRER
jgi:hypothetical protein